MNFRINVTPLDDEARKSMVGLEADNIECKGFGILVVRGENELGGSWICEASIDDLAKTMARDGNYRAAARHAIAYYDGARDIKQKELHKDGLGGFLSMLCGE